MEGKCAANMPARGRCYTAPLKCACPRLQAAAKPQPPTKKPFAHWGLEMDGLDFFETLVPNTTTQ